jgi:hypothetical protein
VTVSFSIERERERETGPWRLSCNYAQYSQIPTQFWIIFIFSSWWNGLVFGVNDQDLKYADPYHAQAFVL